MDSPAVSASSSAFDRRLCHSFVALALALWFGLVVLLYVRWLVYNDLQPLSPAALLLSGTVISVTATVIRAVWPDRPTGFWPAHWIRWALPLAASMLLGLLLCQRVRSVPALVGFWLIVGGGEMATLFFLGNLRYTRWRDGSSSRRPSTTAAPTDDDESLGGVPQQDMFAESDDSSVVPSQLAEPAVRYTGPMTEGLSEPEGAQVTQQLTRCEAPNGGETITGRVRVDFATGERLSAAHLSFTPPLRNIPEVFVDQFDGPAASVAVGSVYAHGARVDVRLSQPAPEPTSVWCELYVVAPAGGTHPSTP